jgi:hypothetical protein
MDPDDTNEIAESAASEPTETPVESGVEGVLNANIGRRTFLAAAALGAAAAGLFNKTGEGLSGLRLGPVSAFAHDISSNNCQSGDVQVLSPFTIVNEPCSCPSGTSFTASAVAVMVNNAASDRLCVTVHLPPKTLSGGAVFGGDFLAAATLTGKSTQTVTATIAGYPCGAGDVTFGGALPSNYDKGPCPDASKPCAGLSWETPGFSGTCGPSGTASASPSKCRFQQIRIIGRGANLTCVDGCTPGCGGVSTLRVSASGGSAPYTFSLAPGGQTKTGTTSATFAVTSTATTTYTATVNFGDGCTRSVTTTINVTPATASISASSPGTCSSASASDVTFTATPNSGTFTWTVNGTAQAATGSSFTLTANPDALTRTVGLSMLTSGGCAATATSKLVSQCVNTTVT